MQPEHLQTLLATLEPAMTALAFAIARVAGLLLGLPTHKGQLVHKRVLAIVALSLGFALMLGNKTIPTATNAGDLAVSCIMEFVLGLAIGFVLQLALAAVEIAGEIIGVEMGLSFAAVADPLSSGQSTAIKALLGQLGVQLALASGLERVALRGLHVSLNHHPLGHAHLSTRVLRGFFDLGDAVLTVALHLALPVMGAVLALKIALALLSRIAPKLQVFTLAFGLSIIVGLFVFKATLPHLVKASLDHFETFSHHLLEVANAP